MFFFQKNQLNPHSKKPFGQPWLPYMFLAGLKCTKSPDGGSLTRHSFAEIQSKPQELDTGEMQFAVLRQAWLLAAHFH
jgi:hypothetical protein